MHTDSRTLLFTFLIFTNLCIFVLATDNDLWYRKKCYDNGNYTLNSTYSTNLNILLSSLPSNMGDTGFYNASLGEKGDQIYASALCRGDLQLDICRECVKNGSALLFKECPNRKQALVWVDMCVVRYSNESFFGIADYSSYNDQWTYVANVTNPVQFSEDLTTLVVDLLNQTGLQGSLMKFAAGNGTGPGFQIIYALLQCTPDIPTEDCLTCLRTCAQTISWCCQYTKGAGISVPSCNLRYGNEPFYNITRFQEVQLSMPKVAPVPLPMPQDYTRRGRSGQNITRIAVVIVVAIILSLTILACFGVWLRKRIKKKPSAGELPAEKDISASDSLRYEFKQIQDATNDFSTDNVLGRGGFGVVYKGKLQNGEEIAVKRLIWSSTQGDIEFRNEVMLLAKLQHRNLVRLVGFAQEQKERILIYEFIHNASLDHFLFDPTKAQGIDWNRRFIIIKGIAKGLLYLHEDSRLRIIHRDLKPSNILLDRDMNPKIADFGLARLCEHDENEANTSKIAGTFGYMAPEYVINGQFSIKSDVYSFGVIVLEIITGQKNNVFQNGDAIVEEGLLNFAWKNWRAGTITNLLNPILRSYIGSYPEITRCVHVALLCTQENVSDRPTMASVVLMLSSSTATLPLPSKPTFFVHSSRLNDNDSRDDDVLLKSEDATLLADPKPLSENDISVSELEPR